MSYFYITALNLSKRRNTESVKRVGLLFSDSSLDQFRNLIEPNNEDQVNDYLIIAYDYMNSNPKTKEEKFFRTLCKILTLTNSKAEAMRVMGIPKPTFYRSINQLKTILTDEYKRIH